MREFLIKIKKNVLFLILIFFPTLFSLITFNDLGSWATIVIATSKYGIVSQIFFWVNWLIFALIADLTIQTVFLTKKGVGELIRERYGVSTSLIFFLMIFIVNQASFLQHLTGLQFFNQLFNLPNQIFFWLEILFIIILFNVLSLGRLKRIIIFSIFFHLIIIYSTFQAKPNWLKFAFESLVPSKNFHIFLNPDYLFTRLALLGASISFWNFILISSFYSQKKVGIGYVFYNRLITYFFGLWLGILTWIISVNIHQRFYLQGINPALQKNLFLMFMPIINEVGMTALLFGIFSLAIFGIFIIPLTTTYIFSQIFGYSHQLESSFAQESSYKFFFILHLVIGLFLVFVFKLSLFKITLVADFINVLVIPIFCYFLFNFFNNIQVMKTKLLLIKEFLLKILIMMIIFLVFFTLILNFFSFKS